MEEIFNPSSLSGVLDGLENTDAVHLVVTANDRYQSADAVTEAPGHHRHKRPRLLSESPRTPPTGNIGLAETMSAWYIVHSSSSESFPSGPSLVPANVEITMSEEQGKPISIVNLRTADFQRPV